MNINRWGIWYSKVSFEQLIIARVAIDCDLRLVWFDLRRVHDFVADVSVGGVHCHEMLRRLKLGNIMVVQIGNFRESPLVHCLMQLPLLDHLEQVCLVVAVVA